MNSTTFLLGLTLGAVIGAAAMWLLALRHALAEHRTELARRITAETELSAARAVAQEQQRTHAESMAAAAEVERRFTETFEVLSARALQTNNQQFLETAKLHFEQVQTAAKAELDQRRTAIDGLVKPISETLQKVEAKIEQAEKARVEAHGGLDQQLKAMTAMNAQLIAETNQLSRALRAPNVRGRWGEMQLRRVVEIAGMVEYCDFATQETVSGEGGVRRPDMVIRMPNGRTVVVDSKVPLEHYLNALECTDEEKKKAFLLEHAAQVRRHLRDLSGRAYWQQVEGSPEFVVLFLPGEVFFSAALEQDPSLIEHSGDVILATPTTLIALLKAVAYGWRQEQVAQNARDIAALGKELYERFSTVAGHFGKLGRSLTGAVGAYNSAVSSMESRLLVTARKFRELGAIGEGDVEVVQPVEAIAREISAPELIGPPVIEAPLP